MDLETLQKKHERLVDGVRRMRGYQKEYFKYHASADLAKAKHWERQVDELVKEEVKMQDSKQQELF